MILGLALNSPPKPHAFVSLPLQSGIWRGIIPKFTWLMLLTCLCSGLYGFLIKCGIHYIFDFDVLTNIVSIPGFIYSLHLPFAGKFFNIKISNLLAGCEGKFLGLPLGGISLDNGADSLKKSNIKEILESRRSESPNSMNPGNSRPSSQASSRNSSVDNRADYDPRPYDGLDVGAENHPQMPHQATAEYFGQRGVRSKAVAALDISLNRVWRAALMPGSGIPGTTNHIGGPFIDNPTSPWYIWGRVTAMNQMPLDHARFGVSRLNVEIANFEDIMETEGATRSPAVVQSQERTLDSMRRFRQDLINHVNNNSPTLQAVSSLNNNNNNNN